MNFFPFFKKSYTKTHFFLSLKLFTRFLNLECKIYLAKDSTLTEKEFKDMYPNWKEWEDIVKKIDPKNFFQSKMSNRLGLKNGY